MGKAARSRASRTAREERRQAAKDASKEAIDAAGYPRETLEKAMARGTKTFLQPEDMEAMTGKIIRVDAAVGPRIFVMVELDRPET